MTTGELLSYINRHALFGSGGRKVTFLTISTIKAICYQHEGPVSSKLVLKRVKTLIKSGDIITKNKRFALSDKHMVQVWVAKRLEEANAKRK